MVGCRWGLPHIVADPMPPSLSPAPSRLVLLAKARHRGCFLVGSSAAVATGGRRGEAATTWRDPAGRAALNYTPYVSLSMWRRAHPAEPRPGGRTQTRDGPAPSPRPAQEALLPPHGQYAPEKPQHCRHCTLTSSCQDLCVQPRSGPQPPGLRAGPLPLAARVSQRRTPQYAGAA
ncbi:hypothetical protein P7K49_020697 [Saguinus oedipus]|uniref:Uncharacterized protein n=1 Tax=Saguinus oedipus TaxID=9490 RepID=A0ABQ9V1P6_SAGOE|nr:hypothetical protein P7K49_020697 [Saguinus oedipus]